MDDEREASTQDDPFPLLGGASGYGTFITGAIHQEDPSLFAHKYVLASGSGVRGLVHPVSAMQAEIIVVEDSALVARCVGLAALLLPKADRERYREEWSGELYDLRDEGVTWWRRAVYIADVLRGTLGLSKTLRWHGRRAVD